MYVRTAGFGAQETSLARTARTWFVVVHLCLNARPGVCRDGGRRARVAIAVVFLCAGRAGAGSHLRNEVDGESWLHLRSQQN